MAEFGNYAISTTGPVDREIAVGVMRRDYERFRKARPGLPDWDDGMFVDGPADVLGSGWMFAWRVST